MNKRTTTLLRYGLLFFAAFFSLVAFTQYRFVLSELQRTVSAELRRAADQVQKELVVNSTWDLPGFRRALVEGPSNYIALTKDGLLIDVEGLVPPFLPQITPPKALSLQRALTLTSAAGEEWHLFARPVQGGTVIVGEPASTAEADVDRRLEDNAKRFGGTIEEAASIGERSIDGLVDYAVFDDAHHVRRAAGGIPLAMSAQEVAEKVRQGPRIILDGRPYYVTSTS